MEEIKEGVWIEVDPLSPPGHEVVIGDFNPNSRTYKRVITGFITVYKSDDILFPNGHNTLNPLLFKVVDATHYMIIPRYPVIY